MRAVKDRSAEVVAWAASNIPLMFGRPFEENATAIGVESDAGELVGAVVFHNWFPEYRTIEVSAVATNPRWMQAREAFELMWNYCFDVCKVEKLYSTTPASNLRALRFVWGLGFAPEALLARQYGDDDAVLSSFFKDWRNLPLADDHVTLQAGRLRAMQANMLVKGLAR